MERNCVLVVGVPGAGKPTSVNEFKKIFNRNVRSTFNFKIGKATTWEAACTVGGKHKRHHFKDSSGESRCAYSPHQGYA